MLDLIFQEIQRHKEKVIIIFCALCMLDIFLYTQIADRGVNKNLSIYFLNVGQGDSQLVILPGNVKVLIDGGPINGKVLSELANAFPGTDRYIDLVVMSHAQTDHFGGLIDVFKTYKVGAFLWSGREGTAKSFTDLKNVISENETRTILVASGDTVRYGESAFHVLSPLSEFMNSKELNDTTVVLELESKNIKTIFTGDISSKIEGVLIKNKLLDSVDILKVPHHGSKYSSSQDFIEILKPKLSIVEVGKNSYGHPAPQTLMNLLDVGSSIYRTDEYGTMRVLIDGKKMRVYTE